MDNNTMFIDGKERTAIKGQYGYMYFWLSDGTGVKAHRAIMEKHLGRKLKPTEEVHHIDGNRENNALSNLVVLSKGEHASLHRKKEYQSGVKLFGNDNEKRKRKIVGVNDSGETLAFDSISDAKRAGFTHAYDCCVGRRSHCKGYRWRYAD